MGKSSKKSKSVTLIISLILTLALTFACAETVSAASVSKQVENSTIKTLKLTDNSHGVTVKWSKAKGYSKIKDYKIYRSTSKKGAYELAGTVHLNSSQMKNKTVKFIDGEEFENRTYYYKVRGYKKIDGIPVFTKYSAVKSVKCRKSATEQENNVVRNDVNGATEVKYYEDSDNKRTGLKSFKREDPLWDDSTKVLSYTDVSEQKTISINSETLAQIVQKKIGENDSLLTNWAYLADQMFQQGGNSACVDNYSKRCDASKGNFLNLDTDLAATSEGSRGSTKKDTSMYSGLKQATSLSDVRDVMRDQILERIGRNAIKKEGNVKKLMNMGSVNGVGEESIPEINNSDKDMVLYSTATFSNAISACHYKYGSYSLIFYDFQLTPIADDNIDMITAYEGYGNVAEAAAKGASGVSFKEDNKETVLKAENRGLETSDGNISETIGKNETISCTISNSESISYEEAIKLGFEIKLGKEESGVTGTFSSEITTTFGQVYTSAKEDGKSREITKATTTQYATKVPPHTVVAVTQNVSNTNYDYTAKMPMELTYKVAMVALTGECYADSASTCYFTTSGYEHGNFVVMFGTGGGNGNDARESVDLRSNYGKNYDDANGQVDRFHHEQINKSTSISKTNGIDWSKLPTDTTTKVNTYLNSIISNVPILSCGSKIRANVDKFEYSQARTIPMCLMGSVMFKKDELGRPMADSMELAIGDIKPINNAISIQGYDTGIDGQSSEFYGFDQGADGEWVECDKYGNKLTDGTTGCFKIVNGNRIEGVKAGKGYIMWAIGDTKNNKTLKEKYTAYGKAGTTVNPWETKGDNDIVLDAKEAIVTVTVK